MKEQNSEYDLLFNGLELIKNLNSYSIRTYNDKSLYSDEQIIDSNLLSICAKILKNLNFLKNYFQLDDKVLSLKVNYNKNLDWLLITNLLIIYINKTNINIDNFSSIINSIYKFICNNNENIEKQIKEAIV
jgi:hypothetical protein